MSAPQQRKSGRAVQIGAMLVVCAVATWWLGPSTFKGYDSLSWPPVDAKILDSKLVLGSGIRSAPIAAVSYAYSVGGQEYRGERTNFRAIASDARGAVARAPKGATVKVAVNPADARESVLEPSYSALDLGMLVLSWLATIAVILEPLMRRKAGAGG